MKTKIRIIAKLIIIIIVIDCQSFCKVCCAGAPEHTVPALLRGSPCVMPCKLSALTPHAVSSRQKARRVALRRRFLSWSYQHGRRHEVLLRQSLQQWGLLAAAEKPEPAVTGRNLLWSALRQTHCWGAGCGNCCSVGRCLRLQKVTH